MSPATLALIAQVISLILSAAEKTPAILAAAETSIGLLQSNSDPTADQEAAIRTALDQANSSLQSDQPAPT